MSKDKDYRKMINSARWLHLRREVLSERPLCERCLEQGNLTPAAEVHHRTPVETALLYSDKAALMFDPSNLQALCHACHVYVHKELIGRGKEATKERNKSIKEQVIKTFFE